jgi:hypothetical protein
MYVWELAAGTRRRCGVLSARAAGGYQRLSGSHKRTGARNSLSRGAGGAQNMTSGSLQLEWRRIRTGRSSATQELIRIAVRSGFVFMAMELYRHGASGAQMVEF